MAESWSTDRLTPMLRDSEVFKDLIKDPRSRDAGNKILYKRFPGGHITMAGSNSPSSLASRPVRLVLCDEVDRYPASSGSEGDPVNLARKRATTFWNRKIILTSTPTIKDISRIEAAYEQSDQRRYYVPCPCCGHYQTLKWPQLKWTEDKTDTAYYVCEINGGVIKETSKPAMLLSGRWQAMLVSKSNEAIQIIAEGQTIVKANLALLEKYDGRSHVKQVLDALENMILGKASRDQSSYSIAGRSLSRLSPSELLRWRDLYKAEYTREQKGDRLRQGLVSGNIIKVRF